MFSFIAIIIYRNEYFIYLRSTALLVFIFLSLQTFLGILTVLSGAQIIIASMHQTGSILLITTSLILVFKNSRIN
jgi:cytochrome c oxidase assembly protein subunit 15